MNSIPWNRLPFAIAPNLPLPPRTEWRGGGRLYKWDILPMSRAASLASQHAGKEITPADFFEAAARGEIILRAPAHRSARIKNLVGAGLLEIDGKALADTIEKEQVLYLPMATCRRLAQTGRASWRDIVMYKPLAPEHGSFVPMQYTLAKLVDGEPDFEAVAEDCFASVEGMHALADDVLLDVQAAASASESDAPGNPILPIACEIPGKKFNVSSRRLAVKAAWEIECETGRAATDKATMELLQLWADAGKEPDVLLRSDRPNRAVKWLTTSRGERDFDIDACRKTLADWMKSRE